MKYRCSKCKRFYDRDSTKAWIKSYCEKTQQYARLMRVKERKMIYMTFKQWADGRFLETGEPRKKAYSKAELDLIEMGWNYGRDAGIEWQKRQTALDKKADNARELGLDYEPQEKNA